MPPGEVAGRVPDHSSRSAVRSAGGRGQGPAAALPAVAPAQPRIPERDAERSDRAVRNRGIPCEFQPGVPLVPVPVPDLRPMPNSPLPCSALLALSSFALSMPAQTLVRDIAPPSFQRSSSPSAAVDLNGVAIFVATTAHGSELWRSDGTLVGTFLLKDINPGAAGSSPARLVVVGNQVFFTATVLGLGNELWVTDGTAQGTRLVRDGSPGTVSGAPTEMAGFGGFLYFVANDGVSGSELWRSDGTPAGTGLWLDIWPGAGGSSISGLVAGPNALWFAAAAPGFGTELWRSDGTVAGTGMVRDFSPGASTSSPQNLVVVPNGVYFTANNGPGLGIELCFSDGTAAGTALTRDIVAGTGSLMIWSPVAWGNRLLFGADDQTGLGQEPWISDGTAAGTFRLADLAPGVGGSSPAGFVAASSSRVVFQAYAPASGFELYVTDGTAAGTQQLVEFYPGTPGGNPDSFVAAFGGAVFAATDVGAGSELWFTDGTAAGTRRIADAVPGSTGTNPTQLARVGSRVFCRGYSPSLGIELYVSDGTVAGTTVVADLATPSADANPREITPLTTGVVFGAADPQQKLWRSDGTGAGTYVIDYGAVSNYVNEAVGWNGFAYVSGVSATAGYELLRTDGTQANSTVLDIVPGIGNSDPTELAVANGRVWFGARSNGTGVEPYVSDGTMAGTVFLADLWPGGASSQARDFTACGSNRVVFVAFEPTAGRELWTSDGTPAGTQRVVDLVPGTQGSEPDQLLAAGNVAYFSAYQTAVGYELFVTDGTAAGTQLVANLATGSASSQPQQLVRLANGTVLFVATVTGAGAELCRTDGTSAGTVMVGQIVPGTIGGSIEGLVAVGNVAYFTADDGVTGRELWRTDGFTLTQVRDIYPGSPNGVLGSTLRASSANGGVVFAGSDGNDGLQVWVSDGTAVGTTQVGKIGPWAGSGAVDLGEFVESAGDTWFWCDDGITGKEPWRISLQGVVAATTTFGLGCRGTANRVPAIGAVGLPQLGNAGFGIRVTNGLPLTAGIVAVGTAPTAIQFGNCRVLVAPPWTTLPTVFLDGAGAATTPLPIPATPTLAGLSLHAQYLVLDPNGDFLAFAALSNGLSMLLGN